MKKLSTLIAVLALGATACAADEPAPAAPAAPATPAAPAPAAPAAPAAEKKPHRTPEETLAALDTDKSGDISLAEFKASPRGQKNPDKADAAYKKLDANNDGKVTLEELKAHEKKPK